MAGILAGPRHALEFIEFHRHIIWALLLREISTRYGRDNLGFLWLLVEPTLFCVGVSALYTMIRGPIEYGMTVAQFTITGYMPMLIFRQGVNFSATATKSNNGLLYHRQITPLHLFIGRFITEFCGVTLAFVVLIMLAHIIGVMPLPKNILILSGGWLLISLQAFGCAMFMNAIAEVFEPVERVIPILTYMFLPVSGFLFMISGLPQKLAHLALILPFIHCFEMIRSGYFGEFLAVTYDAGYALEWGIGFTVFGLALQQFVRPRVEVF